MNDRYAYALMFDRDDRTNFKQLHEQLVSLECIKNWFHYIKSSYILISDKSTANALDQEIKFVLKDRTYLIIGIDLRDSQGWLPEKAGEWIERQREL